ncbi:MAG: hypothetical protein FWE87_05340 [Coriobacteriia bacterium]|nr:hypothetical protein [Coriobacteriia bacterium]
MDRETVQRLRELNNEFYLNNCDSFSKTRKGPWEGWFRCIDIIADKLPLADWSSAEPMGDDKVFSVFDLGCGNLRFKTFLENAFPELNMAYFAVDNCQDMIPMTSDDGRQIFSLHFQDLDAIEVIADGESLNSLIDAPLCNLSVSFGFMHHVPNQENRKEALRALVDQTYPGGLVIVSLWQFMSHPELADKMLQFHARACDELHMPPLEPNDFILGWQNLPDAYRYCHSFTDEDIDDLVDSIADKADLVARFTSDGRTHDLNSYVVFQVK